MRDGQTVGRSDGQLSRARHAALALAFLTALPPGRLTGQCPDGTPPPCATRPARVAAGAPAPNSVAVLYFDNLSRDTSDAYLADGLTEAIITRLSAIARLEVKSRHAVRRFRGTGIDDPAVVARTLNVVYLVTGSVRRAGSRLRVSAELIRAAGGVQIWGQQFDEASGDVFSIQEAVAREVAIGIVGRLLPAERVSVAARPTRNPAAYDRVLRGNFYLAQRAPQAVRRAIDEYEAAARLDPGYADPLARVAYAYALFLDWQWTYSGVPAESLLARGFRAADRALQLDSTSSDTWMARGYLLVFRNPRVFEGMREAFARAVALDPRNAEAYHQLGAKLETLGDDSGAVAADLQALALEPNRPITLRNLGVLHATAHRFGEARRWLDSALTVDPTASYAYISRAFFLLQVGDTAAARRDVDAAERYEVPEPGSTLRAARVAVQAAEGDSAAARAGAERLVRDYVGPGPMGFVIGTDVAFALVAVGERGRALDVLERVRPRGAVFWEYLRGPFFDPLRSDPRFRRLVEESRPPGVTH